MYIWLIVLWSDMTALDGDSCRVRINKSRWRIQRREELRLQANPSTLNLKIKKKCVTKQNKKQRKEKKKEQNSYITHRCETFTTFYSTSNPPPFENIGTYLGLNSHIQRDLYKVTYRALEV